MSLDDLLDTPLAPVRDEQAVIAYTREHLANFKTPRSVRFVETLPRTYSPIEWLTNS